jgi:hypothetical protein
MAITRAAEFFRLLRAPAPIAHVLGTTGALAPGTSIAFGADMQVNKLPFLLFTLVASGCASNVHNDVDAVETDEAALRTLTGAEISGSITFGQTVNAIAYTNTPLYRAYRLQGNAGDIVDAWIRSSNGDARAWLLDSAFQNIVAADNSEGTTNARLVTTLKKTGTFYIAFREKTQRNATFQVALAGITPPVPACDPEEENCPQTPIEMVGDVRGADQNVYLPDNYRGELTTLGDPALFDGEVSFDIKLDGDGRVDVTERSLDGGSKTVIDQERLPTHFERLALPVFIGGDNVGPRGSNPYFTITNLVYHIKQVKADFALTTSRKNSFFENSSREAYVATIGNNLKGNKLTFTASGKAFKNWSNGLGCTAFKFNDQTLAPDEVRTITVTAPIAVSLVRSCFSGRLELPENRYSDGNAFLSNLKIGAP